MIVFVSGSQTLISRLRPLLNTDGVEMITISKQITGQQDLDSLKHLSQVNLVILDTKDPGFELICNYFRKRNTPLALLVNETQTDWGRLSCQQACAFIPHSSGEKEFAARLRKVIAGIKRGEKY